MNRPQRFETYRGFTIDGDEYCAWLIGHGPSSLAVRFDCVSPEQAKACIDAWHLEQDGGHL